AKRRAEQVHSQKGDIANPESIGECLAEPKRIKAHVTGKHLAPRRHAQKVAELTGPAAGLENQRAVGKLSVEHRGERAAARLCGQAFAGIEAVVVGKG